MENAACVPAGDGNVVVVVDLDIRHATRGCRRFIAAQGEQNFLRAVRITERKTGTRLLIICKKEDEIAQPSFVCSERSVLLKHFYINSYHGSQIL